MNKTLKEKNSIKISGVGQLVAIVKGTRKYGKPIIIRDPETGKVTFRGRPLIDPGIIVHQQETHNIICNEGLELLAGFSVGEVGDIDGIGITMCEIGTGAAAPAAGDTTLTTYHNRIAITSSTRLLYVCTFRTFFTAAEATAAIEEAGVWGGVNAVVPGEATGLLFAHWLSSFDNTGGLFDITFSYILTIDRM